MPLLTATERHSLRRRELLCRHLERARMVAVQAAWDTPLSCEAERHG